MIIIIVIVVIVLFFLLSNNLFNNIIKITENCIQNNPEIIDLCKNNSSIIPDNFTRCFTSQLDNLKTKENNKNPLKKLLDYIRTLPSGKLKLIKSLTGVNKVEKIKIFVCNMINKQNILDNIEIISEE